MPLYYKPEEVLRVLHSNGAVYQGQQQLFVGASGKILDGYVNCEVLFPHSIMMHRLVADMVAPFLDLKPQGFVSAATGDIVMLPTACALINSLGGNGTVLAWADKVGDGTLRIERNGFAEAIEGLDVVVLNDRISNGGTTLAVISEARRCGANVIGVATLAGISRLTPEQLGVPMLHQLCTVDVNAWLPDEVPFEYRTWPIVVDPSLGHGVDFARSGQHWAGGFVEVAKRAA